MRQKRAKKENGKDTVLTIRIRATDKAELKNKADKMGIDLTKFIESLFKSELSHSFA